MNKIEILEKIIEKAKQGGYPLTVEEKGLVLAIEIIVRHPRFVDWDCYSMIFNHDFAKAFWGEEIKTKGWTTKSGWQFHLQQMVLEEDPIKYLEKFL